MTFVTQTRDTQRKDGLVRVRVMARVMLTIPLTLTLILLLTKKITSNNKGCGQQWEMSDAAANTTTTVPQGE